MKKVLIFDTETDGLPLNFKVSAEDDYLSWPHIVQICAQIYDVETETILKGFECLIKPVGYHIPPNMIHNISHEEATKKGVLILDALIQFEHFVNESDYVIAHNYAFDYNVVNAAFLAITDDSPLFTKKSLCTMKMATNICKISGGYRGSFKWPRLEELYFFLFNENFTNAHSANGDVEATAKCYFFLRKKYNIDRYIF